MFDRHARLALILACFVLAGSAAGFRAAVKQLNVVLEKQPVELRNALEDIPRRLDDWDAPGERLVLTAEAVEALGTSDYVHRTYLHRSDRSIGALNFHAAYYTGMIDAVPHVPDRCFVATGGMVRESTVQNLPLPLDTSGWETDPEGRTLDGAVYEVVHMRDPITNAPLTVRMPMGEVRFRVAEYSHPDRPGTRIYGGYFFVTNGRVAYTPEQVKAVAFRHSEKHAYYCKLQIAGEGPASLTMDVFLEQSASLIDEILPELMRCLPDWSEVEALPAS